MRKTKSFRLNDRTIRMIKELSEKMIKAKSEVIETAVEHLYTRGMNELKQLEKKNQELRETIEIMKHERVLIDEIKKLYEEKINNLQNEIIKLQNENNKLQNEIIELQNEKNKKWKLFK